MGGVDVTTILMGFVGDVVAMARSSEATANATTLGAARGDCSVTGVASRSGDDPDELSEKRVSMRTRYCTPATRSASSTDVSVAGTFCCCAPWLWSWSGSVCQWTRSR